MKRKLITLMFMLLLVICIASAEEWIIDGDSVYVDDAKVFINATPHTLYTIGSINFDVISKVYTGDVDIIIGNVNPKKVSWYSPYTRYWNTTEQVSFNSYVKMPTSSDCDYGLEHSNYKHTVIYLKDRIGSFPFLDMKTICYDYSSPYNGVETFYWNNNQSEDLDYLDKTNTLVYKNKDYENVTDWYIVKNVPIVQDEMFKIKVDVYSPSFTSDTIKYWFAIKPSSESLQEAISNGHLYYLDPWLVGSGAMDFLDPTPSNATFSSDGWTVTNLSINVTTLETLKFNWDGTNSTFYSDDLLLYYNFDNIAEIGDTAMNATDLSRYQDNMTTCLGTIDYQTGMYGNSIDLSGMILCGY